MNEKINDKILNQNIDRLDISCKIIDFLKEKNIISIKDLSNKTKKNLETIGLESDQIKEVEIGLQLEGFNLRNNY